MAVPRLRRVSSKRDFDNVLDEYHTQGYEVLNQGENSALLRKKNWGSGLGHLFWLLFTSWWTFGVGNLIYALIAHYGAEQVMIKIDENRA